MLNEHISFVKWQLNHSKKEAAKSTNPRQQLIRTDVVQKFESLLDAMKEADKLLEAAKESPKPAISSLDQIDTLIALRPNDLAGLPDEVRLQLSIKDNGDATEMAIQEIIEAAGGVMSLDQIIIGYYRKKDEVLQRNHLTSKLYRMAKKGLIYNVPGKKGVYSTFDPSSLQSEKKKDSSFIGMFKVEDEDYKDLL